MDWQTKEWLESQFDDLKEELQSIKDNLGIDADNEDDSDEDYEEEYSDEDVEEEVVEEEIIETPPLPKLPKEKSLDDIPEVDPDDVNLLP